MSELFFTSSLIGAETLTSPVAGMDRRGLLSIALDERPFHARKSLHGDLLHTLDAAGIPSPSGFMDLLGKHHGVISGSFVPSFIEPDFVKLWESRGASPGDVDVYVGKGGFQDVLDSLRDLSGAEMEIISEKTRPTPFIDDDGFVQYGPRDDVFYNNIAIESMARIKFQRDDGEECYMDLMESKSRSPFMPILRFDLSHLRRAISADGLFDFHPSWHGENKTYATATAGLHSGAFLDKYVLRGYDVDWSGEVSGLEKHSCKVSPVCPLAERNTADGGVRFVPFTEEAAARANAGTHEMLRSPIVFWRHGGGCSYGNGEEMTSLLYDSAGVDALVEL